MRWFAKSEAPLPSFGPILNSAHIVGALTNLREQGDGDVLPIPFEFTRMSSSPKAIQNVLDLQSSHTFGRPRRFSVIRFPYKSRIVAQLKPADSLYADALLLSMANLIEARRRPIKELNVFSNRVDTAGSNSFYLTSDWKGFAKRGLGLAASHRYALKLDVANFYPSIPHKYLGELLLGAGVARPAIQKVLDMLQVVQDGTFGVPIGPHFSHLLAELSLCQVDDVLSKSGVAFCRFQDDFHIFTSSVQRADQLTALLDTHLQSNLQTRLNLGKKYLIQSDDYVDSVFGTTNSKTRDEEIFRADIVASTDLYLPRPSLEQLQSGRKKYRNFDVSHLLSPYLYNGAPDYETIARLLKMMQFKGVPSGLSFLIQNIGKLLPVVTEVFMYMETVAFMQKQVTREDLVTLTAWYDTPIIVNSEFLQVLMIRILGKTANSAFLSRFVGNLPYITNPGRRELIAISLERDVLREWATRQEDCASLFDEWALSALEHAKVEWALRS